MSAPSTPAELSNAIFGSCHEDESQAAVFQQELIIACADLVDHKRDIFDGVLTIRLAWLTEALQLLLAYIRESQQRATSPKNITVSSQAAPRSLNLPSFLDVRLPTAVLNELSAGRAVCVYDLSPTVVRSLLSSLMTKKSWQLL